MHVIKLQQFLLYQSTVQVRVLRIYDEEARTASDVWHRYPHYIHSSFVFIYLRRMFMFCIFLSFLTFYAH